MSPDPWRRVRLLVVACILAVVCWRLSEISPAQGQSASQVQFSPIDQTDFPRMQALLGVYNEVGEFIHGLEPAQVQILEGGQSLPAGALLEQQPGAQFVTAVIYGPGMGVRDLLGVSRYEALISGLVEWRNDWPAVMQDDFSLIVDNGPELTHQSDPGGWLQALQAYVPANLRTAQPNVQVLSRALDIAAQNSPRPGMGRGVLLITPILPLEANPGLQNLAATAQAQGIRVHVWLIVADATSVGAQLRPLQDLAALTGGQFYMFDGTGAVPSLEEYLIPLRTVYSLSYETPIRSTGSYTVSLNIEIDGQRWQSPQQTWSRTITPPNPMFMGLPTSLDRQAATVPPPTGAAALSETTVLEPDRLEIKLLIEFPDQSPRPLQRTAFYVDGQMVDENLSEPFDQFVWDLSSYTESGQHLLRVEASDSLGLTGSSLEFPLQIKVPGSVPLWQLQVSTQLLLAGGVGLITTAILIGLVLVLTGRIAPYRKHLKKQENLARRASQGVNTLPRSQPVSSLTGTPTGSAPPAPVTLSGRTPSNLQRLPNWIGLRRRAPASPSGAATAAGAYLTPLTAGGSEEGQGAPLPLNNLETSLGSDPTHATWALNDPALESVHARLMQENDRYRILDAGSTAGTWVNYTLVPAGGLLLHHGDLVHIGRIGFRFYLREKGRERKPTVQPQEPLV